MHAQLALYPDTTEERFNAFHAANPHVYEALVEMARKWKSAGHTSCSMKLLFEVLRWKRGILIRWKENQGDEWTLNNNYTAWYSRLIMDSEPDLAGFFETRGGDR